MSDVSISFEILDISECQRDWNFGPCQKFPDILPAWAVNGYLLSGFHLAGPHPVQNAKDLNEVQAANFLISIYPHLSWPELTRLTRRPGFNAVFDIEQIYHCLGIKKDERWEAFSEFLLHWPGEVQDYLSEKFISPFDMPILSHLEVETQIDLLTLIISRRPSKSAFCHTLELAGELIMMGTPTHEIAEVLKSHDPLTKLRLQRFRQSSHHDEKMKESLESWSWPHQVHKQVQRKGDVRGVEIKFFVKDPQELDKTLKGLQNTISNWKKWQDEFDQSI